MLSCYQYTKTRRHKYIIKGFFLCHSLFFLPPPIIFSILYTINAHMHAHCHKMWLANIKVPRSIGVCYFFSYTHIFIITLLVLINFPHIFFAVWRSIHFFFCCPPFMPSRYGRLIRKNEKMKNNYMKKKISLNEMIHYGC